MKDKYLRETRMVDFSNPAIQKLIQNMKWKKMGEFERIKAIYMKHQKIYMTMFLRKEIFSANCILSYFGVALMIMI